MSIPDQTALSFRFTNSPFVKRTLLESYLKPHAAAPLFPEHTQTAVLVVSLAEPGKGANCIHAHFVYQRRKDAAHWIAVQLTRTVGSDFEPIASSDLYCFDNKEQTTMDALELYDEFRRSVEHISTDSLLSLHRKVAWTVIQTKSEHSNWMELLAPYQ